MRQDETLKILAREKNYEDELATKLLDYFLGSLDNITDLSAAEREHVKEILGIIASDSQRHSYTFNSLSQKVLENGEDDY